MTVTVASSVIANPEVLIEKCKHSACLPTNVVFLVDQGAVHSHTKERSTPMFKLALRYARYALSALATIGFALSSN